MCPSLYICIYIIYYYILHHYIYRCYIGTHIYTLRYVPITIYTYICIYIIYYYILHHYIYRYYIGTHIHTPYRYTYTHTYTHTHRPPTMPTDDDLYKGIIFLFLQIKGLSLQCS